MKILRVVSVSLVWLACCAGTWAAGVSCDVPAPSANAAYEYFVSLAGYEHHAIGVQVRYRASHAVEFQMPRWNALYQIRDFAQYVSDVKADDAAGHRLVLDHPAPSTWRVPESNGCVIFSYSVYADNPGPFGAEVDSSHAFLNWAQVLMYPGEERAAPLQLTVLDTPADWLLYDLGLFEERRENGRIGLRNPIQYDKLVDSPTELGRVTVRKFEDAGAQYRLVFDANDCKCDLDAIENLVRRIVHSGVDWMQDRPYDQYTFLYRIPRNPAGGGMEHAYGAAIDATAELVEQNPKALMAITAHEYFHLWNVKRIRPQGLEPVDYARPQDTSALWFSEGVTSTAAALILVRAGLADEQAFVNRLAGTITEFESRPARLFQSPEQSGTEAWLEGYPYYGRPERSVSYYVSGELLGALLDLRIRALTDGRKSLRDLFQWMNVHYAREGRFFDNTRGVQQAAETVTGKSFQAFFQDYVHGTAKIDYDGYLSLVGLKLATVTTEGSSAGFEAVLGFAGFPRVISIEQGSAVAAAGVKTGDAVVSVDGKPLLSDLGGFLANHKAGETVLFRFASRSGVRDVNVTLKATSSQAFRLVDVDGVSPAQRAQRAAWIRGDDLPPGDAR